jgi:hypothetical protein
MPFGPVPLSRAGPWQPLLPLSLSLLVFSLLPPPTPPRDLFPLLFLVLRDSLLLPAGPDPFLPTTFKPARWRPRPPRSRLRTRWWNWMVMRYEDPPPPFIVWSFAALAYHKLCIVASGGAFSCRSSSNAGKHGVHTPFHVPIPRSHGIAQCHCLFGLFPSFVHSLIGYLSVYR